ncbi:MAG: aldo/keto reductase, partial [Nocardioidaceae bacterium]
LTPENTALGDRPLLDALAELAATGVRVGFSTSGPQQAQVIRAALALGASGPFRAVQSTWNLFEQSAGPALTELLAAGWHVTFKETVANGRLTERGIGQPRLETPRHGSRPPDPRGSAELSSTGGVDTILRVAQAHGCSVDVVALAAALAQPATIALMGATTRSQLTSNLEASELDLTVDELAALATTAEDPAAYWRHRATLPWV